LHMLRDNCVSVPGRLHFRTVTALNVSIPRVQIQMAMGSGRWLYYMN
jgi:hypothetical protein